MNIKHISGNFKADNVSLQYDISKTIEQTIKENLVLMLNDIFMTDRLSVYFPKMFSDGNTLDDPLNIAIRIDYSDDDNDFVQFEISLRDLIIDVSKEKEFSIGSSIVSAALRKLADEIDMNIERGNRI